MNTADIIPINQWNKKTNGKERGKTPLHAEWSTKDYKTTKETIKKWKQQGYNLGYRIPEGVVVIDVDPRNAGDKDDTPKTVRKKAAKVRRRLAKDLGHKSWDEVTENNHSVRTGGGGWHIYYRLPEDANPRNYKEIDNDIYRGVEFKKLGRQVLIAGSIHPNETKYEQLTDKKKWAELPNTVLNNLWREVKKNEGVGGGEFTGQQMGQLLEHLDPSDYQDHDEWMALLMACHHATSGVGVEEFVEWSTSDPAYSDHSGEVRYRWDSLDAEKGDGYTYKTLRRQLEKLGISTEGFNAAEEFSPYIGESDSSFEETTDLEHEDFIEEEALDDGDVVNECLLLEAGAPQEEVLVLLRKVRTLTGTSRELAKQNITRKGGPLTAGQYSGLMKALDDSILNSIEDLLANHVINSRFNEGKHIILMANGELWIYNGTHWRPCKDSFIRTMCLKSFERNRKKISGDKKLGEAGLITNATQLVKDKVGVPDNRVLDDIQKRRIINCSNGELWINRDGTHDFKRHKASSYLIEVLPIRYDPKAKSVLFNRTMKEIFPHDTKAMVKYMGEIFGYCIDPAKRVAAWFLFRGEGGDGKSTILKVIHGVLGGSMLFGDIKLLAAGSSVLSNNHASVDLVGRKIVAIEEVPVYQLLDDAGLKGLSEETTKRANPKGRDAYDFLYNGTLIMCSNGYPRVRDPSKAIKRRANIIPFTQQFVDRGAADTDRAADIIANPEELSGVLNWMLKGLVRAKKRADFNTKAPAEVKKATAMWLDGNSVAKQFIEECTTATAPHKKGANLSDLYVAYAAWCNLNGVGKVKSKGFFKEELLTVGYSMGVRHKQNVIMGYVL